MSLQLPLSQYTDNQLRLHALLSRLRENFEVHKACTHSAKYSDHKFLG